MPVAKSYQNYDIVSEPFIVSGRQYVNIKTNKGIKQVRWYTEKEYQKMYPNEKVEKTGKIFKTQKEVLGFTKGYITIFKGDTYSHLDWFHLSICRYAKWWGWYIFSTEEIPADLPSGLTPVRLDWEPLTDDGENLSQNETKIKNYVESLLYDESPSQYVGNLGERLDLTLQVKQTIDIDNGFGHSTMHIFEDKDQNVFLWTTAAKHLVENEWYNLRGTVKNHDTYKNTKQTILTRCTLK